MSPCDTGQKTRLSTTIVTASLITAIILCLSFSLVFLSASGLDLPRSASADTETVNVSYTPSYDTQYSISAPSTLTLAASGEANTLSINVQSWSDFPTDRSLYCDLTAVSSLITGRVADLLTDTTGNKLGETVVTAAFEDAVFLRRYQIIQHKDGYEMRIEKPFSGSIDEVNMRLHKLLGDDADVKITFTEKIPLGKNGKLKTMYVDN